MSNSNSSSVGFLKRNNNGSTQRIFIIFALIFALFTVLFFLLLENNYELKSEKLLERSDFREEIIQLKYSLETEVNNSLQSSLVFNISNKETDRFHTIYSLKTTKNLFEEYKINIQHTSEELDEELKVLSQFLAEYNQSIAASVNKDGRMSELIQNLKQPEDSSGVSLLVDETSISMEPAEAKILKDGIERIYNQLVITESIINSKINSQIEEIKAESSAIQTVLKRNG